MAGIKVTVKGIPALEKELRRLSGLRFDAVIEKQTVEMVDRGSKSHNPAQGGTPYDTGEMIQSIGKSGRGYEEEAGYTKDYAPHVEYGHRTLDGGFVQGQHFLQTNVELQRPIYRNDLLQEIRKGK